MMIEDTVSEHTMDVFGFIVWKFLLLKVPASCIPFPRREYPIQFRRQSVPRFRIPAFF